MKTKKKLQLTASIFMLPVLPFAYWSMKEVYYVLGSCFNQKERLPILCLQDQDETPKYQGHLFIYSNQLNYVFEYGYDKSNFEEVKTFFQGTLLQNGFDGRLKDSLYCVKQELDLKSSNQEDYHDVLKKINLCKDEFFFGRYDYLGRTSSKNENKINYRMKLPHFEIYLKKEFETTSGILISNQDDKVEIRKDGKPLDFQTELLKYFDKDKAIDSFAQELISSTFNNQNLDPQNLTNFQRATKIGKVEVQRLRKSKILTVFAVLPNELGQNAIIWGLSEDKNNLDPQTNKFHWVTDLEDDISVLFNL